MKRRKIPAHDLDAIIPILICLWRKLHKIRGGPSDVLQTREFRSIVETIKRQRGENEFTKEFVFSKESFGAYLMYDWIIRYLEGLHLLQELPSVPNKVLDLCSGAAPFAFSALRHGSREVHIVDKEERFLRAAGEISGRYGFPLTVYHENIFNGKYVIDQKYDLIILAYSLEELFPSREKGWFDRRKAFIFHLLSHLSEDGHLLIVEDSWPVSSRGVLQLRDAMLEEGVSVQAPCIWRGKCPAMQNPKGICYAQRELSYSYHVKEVQRSARIKESSLKMSYLFLKNPKNPPLSFPNERLYRVVSPLIKGFHGMCYHLCGVDGSKKLGSRLLEHSKDTRAFEFLRRGDIISLENVLEDKNNLDLIEGSKIFVKIACGKAVFFD